MKRGICVFQKKSEMVFPLHSYHRLAPLMQRLRMIKEPEEIDQLRKSCEITRDAFIRTMRFMKPGVHEYEVEAEITHEFIRQGAMGHAYDPIIAPVANACFLHYTDNKSSAGMEKWFLWILDQNTTITLLICPEPSR